MEKVPDVVPSADICTQLSPLADDICCNHLEKVENSGVIGYELKKAGDFDAGKNEKRIFESDKRLKVRGRDLKFIQESSCLCWAPKNRDFCDEEFDDQKENQQDQSALVHDHHVSIGAEHRCPSANMDSVG